MLNDTDDLVLRLTQVSRVFQSVMPDVHARGLKTRLIELGDD